MALSGLARALAVHQGHCADLISYEECAGTFGLFVSGEDGQRARVGSRVTSGRVFVYCPNNARLPCTILASCILDLHRRSRTSTLGIPRQERGRD